MVTKLKRQWVMPTSIAVAVAVVVGLLITFIGEMLLGLADPELGQEDLGRLELWFALGGALAVLAVCAFVATRPRREGAPLEQEVALGRRPFFAPDPPPVDVAARTGPRGTVADIGEGYTLYARNGALARVIGVLGGSEEFGRRFQGYLYAQGLHGASDELWIPVEAVYAVYPETRSAFLAIKGDETEHFGWNRMPSSMRRAPHGNHFPSAG